jgi:hypothetical protein
MRDIIEAIDGAISEWETSGDAMRWVPEEKRHQFGPNLAPNPGLVADWHAEGESLPVQTPFRTITRTYDHATHTVTFLVEFDADLYVESMRRVTAALERLTEQFAGLTYSIGDPL